MGEVLIGKGRDAFKNFSQTEPYSLSFLGLDSSLRHLSLLNNGEKQHWSSGPPSVWGWHLAPNLGSLSSCLFFYFMWGQLEVMPLWVLKDQESEPSECLRIQCMPDFAAWPVLRNKEWPSEPTSGSREDFYLATMPRLDMNFVGSTLHRKCVKTDPTVPKEKCVPSKSLGGDMTIPFVKGNWC